MAKTKDPVALLIPAQDTVGARLVAIEAGTTAGDGAIDAVGSPKAGGAIVGAVLFLDG